MTRKGIWGHPRRLCVDSTRRVCEAIRQLAPETPIKYIVVSTEGVDKLDGSDPKRGLCERALLKLLEWTLPPMVDNMEVVRYLHKEVSGTKNPHVDFCAV